MTDYIEQILEEQEEWAEGDMALNLARGTAVRPARTPARTPTEERGAEGTAARQAVAVTETRATEEETTEHGVARTQSANGGGRTERPARGEDSSAALRRRMSTGTSVLAARLRQAEKTANYRAGSFAAPVLTGQTAVRTEGASELDAIFQRDARRYDGGFTLF